MDKCILEKDKPYLVKVDKIEPKYKRTSFQRNGATYYNIMIYATMKDGSKIMVEYPSPTQPRDKHEGSGLPQEWVHDSLELGVMQWIKCLTPSDIACVVEPCDPPDERNTHPVRSVLPQATNDTIKPEERMNTPMEVSSANKPNVRLLSVATSYAKDLKVAEIGRREYGAAVTEQDIADVGKWGLKIFNTMSEQLNF